MNERKEKKLLQLVDNVEETEALGRWGNVPPSREYDGLDAETIRRIGARTFDKLGIPDGAEDDYAAGIALSRWPEEARPVSRTVPWGKGVVAASVLAAVLLLASASPDVRAQVNRLLQFIPGYGTVQPTEPSSVLFVLPEPVVHDTGSSRIEVRGMTVGGELTTVSLTGTSGAPVDEVTLINADGDSYKLKSGTKFWGGDWGGTYYIRETIRATETMRIAFDDGPPVLAVRLQPAREAARIEDLGETSEKGGIRLTAVPVAQRNGTVRVTLVPQLPAGSRIEAFGFGPYDRLAKPRLTSVGSGHAETETELPIVRDETFPNANEFLFRPGEAGFAEGGYRLTVPEVAVVRRTEKAEKLTIPVPDEGVLEVNEQRSLLGFPFKVLRVERLTETPNSMRIVFDFQYDADSGESLQYFVPDFSVEGKSGGMSWKFDENTHAMQHMVVEAPAGKKELTLYMTEVHTVVRGPWTFELKETGDKAPERR